MNKVSFLALGSALAALGFALAQVLPQYSDVILPIATFLGGAFGVPQFGVKKPE